jgi:hypothetical protein
VAVVGASLLGDEVRWLVVCGSSSAYLLRDSGSGWS